MGVTVLDGPIGTELIRMGIPCPPPDWSAAAIDPAGDLIADLHARYARAGATVHTANTFRTKRRHRPADWDRLARRAVVLARGAVPPTHRVAGSIAPLEDCYRPDLSPPGAAAEHAELARVLAEAGCDLLLCETFPHVGEAAAAGAAAAGTGLPVWASLTPGPDASLLAPADVACAADRLIGAGASAVLVNCLPAEAALEYVSALVRAVRGRCAVGVYANPGRFDGAPPMEPERYARLALRWVEAGATIVGVCCTGRAEHVAAVSAAVGGR